MTRPIAPHRPAVADVERSLARLGAAARREAVPPLEVATLVMAALARQRTAALAGAAAADEQRVAPLGWMAAAALAAAVAVTLFALPALESLSGPLVEVYGLLGGGVL